MTVCRCFTSILIAVASLAGPATAQPQDPAAPPPFVDSATIPSTPAYRRAREVLDLVNGFDAGRVRAWAAANLAGPLGALPMDEHLQFFGETHENNGRLVPHSARSYTPPRPETDAVLVVWSELYEAWQAIVVTVEPESPHRIVSLSLSPARNPTDLPAAPRLTDAEVARKASALADRLAARGLFSGTLLLAKNGKPFLTRAVGVANRDFDVPVRLDTKFNLGSMNKMFTAVAVMQLVEQGKLSLDDPASKWLGEDWLPKRMLDRVRIRHLLTHTSGLGSYFNDAYLHSSRELFRRVEDYRPLVRGDSLRFEPGTRWSYSNTGMLLAGAIVEKASGQDYFDYVREHIYRPAGMTRTDCYELDHVNPGLAVGYDRVTGEHGVEYENNVFKHVLRGGPAGGGYSTVEDLLRFDRALRAGKLVGPSSLEQLWRAYPELGSSDYGLGFGLGQGRLGRVVGHSGGFSGLNSQLDMYLDAGYTVAVMANLGGAASPVANAIGRMLVQGR